MSNFEKFLQKIQKMDLPLNTTNDGSITIQQTPRNQIRREGLEALKSDLIQLYGNSFDIVETRDGIVIVVENEPSDLTFSWELKSTIKSLAPYDPFIEADRWEEELAQKSAKSAARAAAAEAAAEAMATKRRLKLERLNRL